MDRGRYKGQGEEIERQRGARIDKRWRRDEMKKEAAKLIKKCLCKKQRDGREVEVIKGRKREGDR